MRKVNLSVIRPWIVKKVVELVGFEDEVVVEYAMGLLEDDSQPVRTLSARYMLSQLNAATQDTRPTQDADQFDGIPDKFDTRVHVCALELTVGGSGFSRRCSSYVCRRKETRNAPGKGWRYTCHRGARPPRAVG